MRVDLGEKHPVENARAVERAIREIAGRQHGLITRIQLLDTGLTADGVRWRVRVRRLQPLHRGVYLIGPPVHERAKEMAAVLACGDGAVISHWSAGSLWELCGPRGEAVDVTVPHGQRGRRPGIRARRMRSLQDGEITELGNIPITTPSRTIIDIAGEASSRELEQAVARAERRQLANRAGLKEVIARHPKRRGVAKLLALLDAGTGLTLTRSAAEECFLALIRKAQLPAPDVNAKIERYEVDFLWRRQRIVVEIDGFAFHSSRESFERDRRRDARLTAMGFRIMRVTWRQLTGEPEAVLARLVAVLVTAPPTRSR